MFIDLFVLLEDQAGNVSQEMFQPASKLKISSIKNWFKFP